MEEKRGTICFFATYRPPVALEIYSVPYPFSRNEVCLTDGEFYNYNGRAIPKGALKSMLSYPKMAVESGAKPEDVDSGRLSNGLLFVSEREDGLERLHIAFRFNDNSVKVVKFAEVYGTFNGARLEDVGGFTDDSIIYVSTQEDPGKAHQPWNAVFETYLSTGDTERLTPQGEADFSPAISPDGNRLAVASLQGKEGGWCGEIEDLQTKIYVIDLDNPSKRELVVEDGGWPTWGSDDVLFFHHNMEKVTMQKRWGVFRVNVDDPKNSIIRVTPDYISAITPAAIDETTVVVATIRKPSGFGDKRTEEQYRHIEVFRVSPTPNEALAKITQNLKNLSDHFNPFVMVDNNGQKHIGYHRCKFTENINEFAVVETKFRKIKTDEPEVGVFRVSGVFPTFSPDGKKLAFVDNEFKAVWVADDKGLRSVYKMAPNSFFSPVWNQNPEKDILYVCNGIAFAAKTEVHICMIRNASGGNHRRVNLTSSFNNAFPSTNRDGTKLVFRSTRDGGNKNLFIMDALKGDNGFEFVQITKGNWTDTHCQWSLNNDWIVFSSNRDHPELKKDPNLQELTKKADLPDPGYFGVYMVKADNPDSWIKVMDSGYASTGPGRELFPGHINHPYFSPDGKSIVVAADLAAVSCEPICLPLFSHSVRSYGDIFVIDIDSNNFENNKNLTKFKRLTHSRYENSTAVWTMYSTKNSKVSWNLYLPKDKMTENPFINPDNSESFLATGHLCIGKRCC